MVEGNMSKFESQIDEFQFGEEFLFERMCTFEELFNVFKTLKSLNHYEI
jgi:hypothetical protein